MQSPINSEHKTFHQGDSRQAYIPEYKELGLENSDPALWLCSPRSDSYKLNCIREVNFDAFPSKLTRQSRGWSYNSKRETPAILPPTVTPKDLGSFPKPDNILLVITILDYLRPITQTLYIILLLGLFWNVNCKINQVCFSIVKNNSVTLKLERNVYVQIYKPE